MAWLVQFGRVAGRLVGQGIDLLYPPRCVFCRAEEPEGGNSIAVVCGPCRRILSEDGTRCSRCGEPLPGAAGGSSPVCRRCIRRPRFDGIAVLAGYGDELRSAILTAKRPGGEFHAAGLVSLLLSLHRDSIAAWQVDVVVPVPMHWLRRAARGTSSADLLSRHLARGLGLPVRGLLRRSRATPMQKDLPPEERAANVRGAFRATFASSEKRILLVDDVTTTGSTLDACRDALKAAGAAAVFPVVVARADRGENASDHGVQS